MGCFYVLVCILCYGTYVFNCYTTCLHTLHFSVISKLNKGYSANADLFYLNYQTQSALRNTLMLLSKVFFYENNELWQYALQSVVVNIILYLPLSQLVELDVKVRAM